MRSNKFRLRHAFTLCALASLAAGGALVSSPAAGAPAPPSPGSGSGPITTVPAVPVLCLAGYIYFGGACRDARGGIGWFSHLSASDATLEAVEGLSNSSAQGVVLVEEGAAEGASFVRMVGVSSTPATSGGTFGVIAPNRAGYAITFVREASKSTVSGADAITHALYTPAGGRLFLTSWDEEIYDQPEGPSSWTYCDGSPASPTCGTAIADSTCIDVGEASCNQVGAAVQDIGDRVCPADGSFVDSMTEKTIDAASVAGAPETDGVSLAGFVFSSAAGAYEGAVAEAGCDVAFSTLSAAAVKACNFTNSTDVISDVTYNTKTGECTLTIDQGPGNPPSQVTCKGNADCDPDSFFDCKTDGNNGC